MFTNQRASNFNLTRFFTLSSAMVILLVALIVSIAYNRLANQQMIQESEEDAVHLNLHFETEIKPFLLVLLDAPAGSNQSALFAELDAYFIENHHQWDVIRVKLFDAEGNVVYDSSETPPYESRDTSEGLAHALQGHTWSKFGRSENGALTANGSSPLTHVVETYSPVYSEEGNEIAGILEIYRNVTVDFQRFRKLQWLALIVLMVAMAGLFAALSFIVRRGDLLLARTRLRLSGILQTTADAIICADEWGNVTLWNDAAEQMFGYSQTQMIGNSFLLLLEPDMRKTVQQRFPLHPGSWARQLFESVAVHQNGTTFPIEVNRGVHLYGSRYEFSAVVRDISERVRTTDGLAILNGIAENVSQSLDLETILNSALTATVDVLKVDIGGIYLLSDSGGNVDLVAIQGLSGDFPEFSRRRSLGQGLAGQVVKSNAALRMSDMTILASERQKDLKSWHAQEGFRSFLGAPLQVEGEAIGAISVITRTPREFALEDEEMLKAISRHVSIAIENARLYQALKEHAVELEDRVVRRTAALQEAMEKAQESDHLKSEFLANVNHELRTPLSNIKLYLDLVEKGDGQRRTEYLETLRRESQRLERLIEDLLLVSRIDQKKVQPELVPIDVNAELQALIADRCHLISSRGLEIKTCWADDLPRAWGSSELLDLMATNLLTNAVNYTPAGGEIVLATSLVESRGKNYIRVSVKDNGPGITQEDKPYLLERFYRGKSGKATKTAGTGLGLAIVKEIADLLRGDLQFESKLGHGSTFSFLVPQAERSPTLDVPSMAKQSNGNQENEARSSDGGEPAPQPTA